MILGYWLDQPVWLMFSLLGLVFGLASALLCLLTNWRVTRPTMLRLGRGMVPTYFTAISILLSLLIGSVANDAWERQRQASRVVQTERSNMLAIHDLSIASVSDMAAIREALFAYLDILIQDEWPQMAESGSAPQAGQALARLMQRAADPRHAAEAGSAAHAALLDAVMHLRTARGDRLSLSDVQGDQSKWLTLLALAGLTLMAIAFVHLDNPFAQGAALGMFSVAMVVTLGVVALHERPFDGPLALSPASLISARAAMVARIPDGATGENPKTVE